MLPLLGSYCPIQAKSKDKHHLLFFPFSLPGVIPANGEVRINVTFTPFQYETSQVTIQLVIAQFNTKPYLCTITGSSAPHLARG